MSKVYGYCRTARAGNIEEQRELVSNYCKAKGLDIAICFCDDGVSANKVDRVEMGKLLDVLEKGDTIITRDYSRFTRNPIALQIFMDDMKNRGVEIMCIEENEDDSAPAIRAWFEQRWAK
jgi:DNA invertase Pin-like site-specific DNA recombinase